MSLYIESLLYDLFVAQGCRDAVGTAKRAADIYVKAKRDQTIWEMSKTMKPGEIALRYGLSTRQIAAIVQGQAKVSTSQGKK